MRVFFRWTWLSILFLPAQLNASEQGAMQRIMQGMSNDMVQIADGIWCDDYARVAAAAESIAEHPMPSLLERLALLGRLGGNAPQFMKADEKLQAAALALKEVAGERSMEKVLNRYQALQQNCVACHNWYRGIAEQQNQMAEDDEL